MRPFPTPVGRPICAPITRAALTAVLLALALLSTAPPARAAQPAPAQRLPSQPASSDQVIVFSPSVSRDAAWSTARASGLEPLEWNEALGSLGVRSATDAVGTTTVSAKIASVSELLPVRFSEPDVPAALQSGVDDPLFSQQWALETIAAPAAWQQSPDVSDVVVAVLDSGVVLDHEDLVGQLEPGTDIFDGDDDPTDSFGHGTMIAGIVGAATDNGVGVAGVAPGVRIQPVRITNDSGSSSYSRIASGITWAADHGADIITISAGATVESELLTNAVSYARDRDVVVIAAAGNGGDTIPFYPAAIDGVIAVAATTPQDTLWSDSAHGSWISLSAPGSSILSTYLSGYIQGAGTSFAAPHVAAVAAMVRSIDPTLSAPQVEALLLASATDLGASGFDSLYGHGLLDAAAAVAMAVDGSEAMPPTSCSAPSTLIVVGRKVDGADRAIGDRMSAAGSAVAYIRGADLDAVTAASHDLVVLSATVRQRDLPSDIDTIAAPVLTLLPASIPLLGMSGSHKSLDSGKQRRSRSVAVVGGQPLSADLDGSVELVTASMDLYWSRPAATALIGATLDGNPDHAALFGYESGRAMANGTAPDRRGAMPLSSQALTSLTPEGWALLDAAAAWTAGCTGE